MGASSIGVGVSELELGRFGLQLRKCLFIGNYSISILEYVTFNIAILTRCFADGIFTCASALLFISFLGFARTGLLNALIDTLREKLSSEHLGYEC